MSALLQIQNLSLSTRNKEILQTVNLEIQKGEIFYLLGKNGSGKSTLLKALLGVFDKVQGRISLQGIDILNTARTVFLPLIGGLIEQAALYPHLSASDNLRIIGSYYPKALIAPTRIREVLTIVGLEQVQQQKVATFSQGMRQRLGLALAILHQPILVLLDEPTNTLDPEAIAQLRQLIERLNKEQGTTFLINSHQVEEAERSAHRYAILKEGQLVYRSEARQEYVITSALEEAAGLQSKGRFTREGKSFELYERSAIVEKHLWEKVVSENPSLEEVFLALHHSNL